MPLLDYTTRVPAARTVGEIHDLLARAGARGVLTDYDGAGHPIGIGFVMDTNLGRLSYRLPANLAGVLAVLQRQHGAGKIDRRYATEEHATRVAWRILSDWLRAQVALLDAQLASLPQVMLPYLVERDGRTLYETWEGSRLALPPGRGEQ